MKTIADEQRERSDAMAAKGVEAWKAEHDERSADDKQGGSWHIAASGRGARSSPLMAGPDDLWAWLQSVMPNRGASQPYGPGTPTGGAGPQASCRAAG